MNNYLGALKQEIDNMVITSPAKAKLAENIIIAIDNLSELLAEFSNE